MHKVLGKQKGSKIGVVAGMPSSDYKGRRLLEILSLIAPESNFFGVGGPQMKAFQGFKNYGHLDKIGDKPFYPIFNYEIDPRFYLNLPLLPSNLHNAWLLREMKKRDFWRNFEEEEGKDVDMLFVVGNELLSHRLTHKIANRYHRSGELKPITVHVDATHRRFTFNYTKTFDFHIHTLPLRPTSADAFEFPGQFIGKQVVFDAMRFLYSQSARFRERVAENTIELSQQVNVLATEEIAFHLRHEFRERHFIAESCHLFFVSPGSEENEIRANLRAAGAALEVFTTKFTQDNRFSRKNFGVVVSLPAGRGDLAALAASSFSSSDILIRIVVGNEGDERYRAMAACDLGAAAKGDSVLECTAFQLPTVVLDNSNFVKSYIDLMYNVHASEINWTAGGEVLPETTGRNFASKIAEYWGNWFVAPKTRYKLALRCNKLLLSLLPRQKSDFPIDVLASSEEQSFETYYNPELVLANFVKNVRENFLEIKHNVPARDKAMRRKALVLGADRV